MNASAPVKAPARLLLAAGIALALFIYGSNVRDLAFPYDDYTLVMAPTVLPPYDLRTVKTALTPGSDPDFYPLRQASYIVDHLIFGNNAIAFKWHQLLLLGELGILLFLILLKLEVASMPAAVLTALWVLSPVHVEMTSWVAARKDILALVYGAYSVLFFLWALERPKAGTKKLLPLSLVAFLFSALSKASLNLLPLALVAYLLARKKSRKPKNKWDALASFTALAIGASTLLSGLTWWVYTAPNDMTAKYPLAYRAQASAAALGKSVLGWIVPSLNVLDNNNFPPWLSYNSQYVIIGEILWLAMGAALWQAIRKKSQAGFVFMSVLLALYLPTCGLFFPHIHFYSVRYLEPCFFACVVGLGLLARDHAALIARHRKSVVIVATVAMIYFAAFTWKSAALWSEPLRVGEAAVEKTPDSPLAKAQLFFFMKWRLDTTDAEPSLKEKIVPLIKDLDAYCASAQADDRRLCANYWKDRIDVAGAPEGTTVDALVDKITEIQLLYPETAQSAPYLKFSHLLHIGRADRDAAAAWLAQHRWEMLPETRLMHWFAACLKDGPSQAKSLLDSYFDNHLLVPFNVERFVKYAIHSNYADRAKDCK